MGNKVLIIGGIADGVSVAARVRCLDENAGSIMFEKDIDLYLFSQSKFYLC